MESYIHLIAYLSLIYAVILIVKKNRCLADIILAVWLVFNVISFGSGLVRWQAAIGYTHCVFLYLYVKCMLSGYKPQVKDLLHFIPFLIITVFSMIAPSPIYRKYMFIFNGVWVVYISIYFTITIKSIINYKKDKNTELSSDYSPDLLWLQIIIGITILFHLMTIFYVVAYYTLGWKLRTISNLIILVLLNVIGLKALIMDLNFFKKNGESKTDKSKLYSTYHMEEDEALNLETRLRSLMENDKMYLISELSLKDLADKLNIPSHHISYLLNVKFDQNFYEFVNTYRLEAVKNEFLNPNKKNISITAIAYDCGFNSQSTFNRFFKQKEGMTPSKFREQSAL